MSSTGRITSRHWWCLLCLHLTGWFDVGELCPPWRIICSVVALQGVYRSLRYMIFLKPSWFSKCISFRNPALTPHSHRLKQCRYSGCGQYPIKKWISPWCGWYAEFGIASLLYLVGICSLLPFGDLLHSSCHFFIMISWTCLLVFAGCWRISRTFSGLCFDDNDIGGSC